MTTRTERILAYAFLTLFAVISLFPIVGMVLLSLNPRDAPVSGFGLPEQFHPHTYVEAWDVAHLGVYLRSSAIVTAAVVIGATALSVLAGYAFGTMKFRGQSWLFYILISGMILPFEAVVVPLYYDLRQLGLTNTYASMVLPLVGFNVCFGTFWMRAYFRSVPRSMLEAAEVDGAGSFRTLIRVALPPGKPAVLTLVVLLFMWSWNEFLLPLIMVTDEDKRTAPLGLAFFAGQHTTDRIGQAAAAVIVAAPVIVIFIAFQRSFISGISAGAVKE
jgi:raffinose/stachyose/melibiose transport system permease protein